MKPFTATLLLIPAAVLLLCTPARAQGKPSLEGIWQMSYVSGPEGHSQVRYAPIWKIYSHKDRFNIMMWRSDDLAAYLSTGGTYRVVNDSILTESVEQSATNPDLKDTRTVIKYQFLGADMLFMRYNLPGSQNEGQELWTRVSKVGQAGLFPLETRPGSRERKDKVLVDTAGVYLATEQMPVFANGGTEGLNNFLERHISYPVEAQERGLEGVVLLRFVVSEDGVPQDFRIIKSATPLLDQEAIRVLRQARFIPGRHNGHAVKVYSTVPVNFKLK